ncbi:MAG: efflux RND transporter periplasmic adaptor subunit [Pseudomonadota bacterium]
MNRVIQRVWFPALALTLLALALVFASGRFAPEPAATEPAAPPVPEARVITSVPGRHQGAITAFGQARARFEVTLSAQVSGRVLAVATEADSGFEVGPERVLVEIEDIQYRMAVADGRRALADARLNLQQEQRQAERALAEWKSAAFDEEPSDLALRVPQLAAADAAIESAASALVNAENNLRLTKVAAPFSAVVVERLVGPGDVVQMGTPLLRIASVDRVEVRVPLSAQQWSAIAPEAGAAVTVIGPDSAQRWPGYVLRLEQHMGRDDRQRALVIAVDEPLAREQPLYPGTFVSIDVPTRLVEAAYRLPATALSPDGLLWMADSQGALSAIEPRRTINLNDEILAIAPYPLGEASFLVRPLANLTVGSRVQPVEIHAELVGGLTGSVP